MVHSQNGKILMGNEGTFESLDTIPYPSWGTYVFADSIRPDKDSGVYQGFCFGTQNSRTIFLIRPYTQGIFLSGKSVNEDWSAWKEL